MSEIEQRMRVDSNGRVRDPAVRMAEPILQFFEIGDWVAPSLRAYVLPYAEMAAMMVECVPRNAERTVALRKLLESRDAALRAMVAK